MLTCPPVSIRDESRDIAGEYEGGLLKYPPPVTQPTLLQPVSPSYKYDDPQIGSSALQRLQITESSQSPLDQHSSLSSPPSNTEPPLPLPNFHPQSHLPKINHPLVLQNAYSRANGIYEIKAHATLVTDGYMVALLQHFCKNIGVFMDYMVPRPVFQRIVPSIALTHPALLNAICACGAYSVVHSMPDVVGMDVALHYYNEANNLLVAALNENPRNLELCTLTAVFITIFEVLCNISYEQRSHIIGIQSLLQQFSFRKNETLGKVEFSSSISEACFIMVLHIDVLTSHLLGVMPHWRPQQWLLGIEKNPSAVPPLHHHYMKILYLISRIVHLNALGYDPETSNPNTNNAHGSTTTRKILLTELYQWEHDLPMPLRPLFSLPPTDRAFAEIFFCDPVCALMHTYYHAAVLTVCSKPPTALNPFQSEDSQLDVDCNYHARRICGIVMTSENMSIGVVTLWCFLLCSKYIYSLSERRAMLLHLERVKKIGWSNEEFLAVVKNSWGGPDWERQMMKQEGFD